MTRIRAKGLNTLRAALLLAALASVHTTQIRAEQPRIGLSRPGIGAGPYRSGLRRLPNDPTLCGPRQNHLFVNRPCFARTSDPPEDSHPPDYNNKPDNGGAHNNGGGPVIVLGGSPYHLDNHGPSGDGPPNHDDDPPPPGGPHLPDHLEPTPEPTYMAVTGLAFAAVWMLARKKRTA
jgi:hypothetical protein